MRLQPLSREQIPLNEPLPFPLLDQRGKIILASGQIISSEMQRAMLWDRGLFQDLDWVETTQPASDAPSDHTLNPASPQVHMGESQYVQYLRMNYPGTQDGFMVRYFGAAAGQSLFVAAPMENDSMVFVKEGDTFDFKSFYGQAIYSFTAIIEKVCFSPFPYLHIKWPDRSLMQKTTVRESRRVQLELPCSIVHTGTGGREQKISGLITNLSHGGAELGLTQALPETVNLFRMVFRVALTEERYLLELNAQIVSRRAASHGDAFPYRYGIRFEQVPRETQLLLYAFVQDLQLTRLETPLFAAE